MGIFIQSTFARTDWPGALGRQLQKWEKQARLDGVGYLGTTSGITNDGKFAMLRRFESQEAARAIARRADLADVAMGSERLLVDVETKDSAIVVTMLGGSSSRATFVQVMRGHAVEPSRMPELASSMAQIELRSHAWRPDILGELVTVYPDGTYTHAAYFTCEVEARRNEQTLPPEELWSDLGALMSAIEIDEYLDLTVPRIT
jgi:hypothetical protein